MNAAIFRFFIYFST
ncbi:pheST operon leader peptide PheM [Escherichia coli]|nr:pheST operon leader peptide PheM [Escherichia coli]